MKTLLQKIADLEKRLEPKKINLKERWDNKEWNKLDGAPEEDECSPTDKETLLKKFKY